MVSVAQHDSLIEKGGANPVNSSQSNDKDVPKP